MRGQEAARWLAGVGWAALAVACAPPVPPPVAPVTPVALTLLLPTVTPTSWVVQQPAGEPAVLRRVSGGPATISLPQEWQYRVQSWPVAPPAGWRADELWLVAWVGEISHSPLNFTLAARARLGLSLEQYMAEAAAELAATAGVDAVSASLRNDLRADGLPAAFLSYRLTTSAGAVVGQQAVLYDDTGELLLLATLVSRDPAGEETLRALLRTLELHREPEKAGVTTP
jgi:hypothetical protein